MKKIIIILTIAAGLLFNGSLSINNLKYFYEVDTGVYNEQKSEYMRDPMTGKRYYAGDANDPS